jgi:hypothetical protein
MVGPGYGFEGMAVELSSTRPCPGFRVEGRSRLSISAILSLSKDKKSHPNLFEIRAGFITLLQTQTQYTLLGISGKKICL